MFLLGFALTAIPWASAQGATGSGMLKGSGTLAVQRCGHGRLHTRAQVVVALDGTWTATSTEAVFSGTWMPVPNKSRQLDLTFDPASEAGFVGSLAGDATELCHTSVQVTSAVKQKFLLIFNRRATRVTLKLRYTGSGTGGGRSGWARSGLTLKGRWTAS